MYFWPNLRRFGLPKGHQDEPKTNPKRVQNQSEQLIETNVLTHHTDRRIIEIIDSQAVEIKSKNTTLTAKNEELLEQKIRCVGTEILRGDEASGRRSVQDRKKCWF